MKPDTEITSSYDPLDVRAQEKALADQARKVRLDEQTEEADLIWLMGSRRGRRIVWRILDQSGVFRLSFSTNAMQMAFAEGNRNFGNRLLTLIHDVCPDQYPTMLKEQTNARNDDGRRNDK